MSIIFSIPTYLAAYEDVPPCFNQLHLTFFKPDRVAEALSLYKQINQSSWRLISNDLSVGAQQVPGIVRRIARARNPNPLEAPFDRNEAFAALQAAFFQVTASVLTKYNLANTDMANGIVIFLWNHSPEIQNCLRNER